MTHRLREGDCLAELRKDLERQAATLKVWEPESCSTWVEACGELLAVVPVENQRVAWAWSLAQALLKQVVGLPLNYVTDLLLSKVAEIRKVQASVSQPRNMEGHS
ncbi:MAG: hypothetical protein H8J66_14815 [Nitrospira sp.]|nr:hypothetical protein [Nitrospira sp.]